MEHHHSNEHNHDKHAGHSVSMFRDKFWISLLLTIPVLLYSSHIQMWFGFTPPVFFGSHLIPFILSSIIYFYGGIVFVKSAFSELKSKTPGMMTLVAMAISVAYFYSVAIQLGLPGEAFFWELATLVTIMLLGHWLEMASIMKAEGALEAIKKLLPDTADKIVKGKTIQVAVSELKVGDLVLVRPGSNVPVDGRVVEGTSFVNESAITGESAPNIKSVGNEVIAGTSNQDGSLTVSVSKIGNDTAISGIMALVAEAQLSKSKAQVLADKAAFGLTILAITTAFATFVFWFFARNTGFALERSITVLIIACPHALGLAIPLVVSISTTLSAKNGLLVRNRIALESARKIDIVLFDKTGTLTNGEHNVTDVWPTAGFKSKEILQLTASLEQNSEHIIGKSIVREANKNHVRLEKVNKFLSLPGLGVSGNLNGKGKFIAASRRYINENYLTIPENILSKINSATKQGKTEVYLIDSKNNVIGAIGLADSPRNESLQTIKALKKLGIKSAMITGDSNDVAKHISKKLGIDEFFAEVKPSDKSDHVKALQSKGLKVAFVGDGVNDAPALAQANIGIAIGGGTDVAIKSADIILVNSNPRDVVKIINLSRATYKKMIQNLVWGTGYNVLAIPLAAGVLYGYGILLAPAIGAVFMSLSTIIVALNAQLLRKQSI